MSKKSIVAALALICSIIPSFAFAEDTTKERTPVPGAATLNVFGPGGVEVPEGLFMIQLNYIHAEKDRVRNNGDSKSANNDNEFNLGNLKFSYGLGNGWDIRTATPFIFNDFNGTDNGVAPNTKSGVSDSSIILRKNLFKQEDGYLISFAAGLGLQVPTGDTSYDGVGTGAWGLLPEIGATYAFDGGRQLVAGGMSYWWIGTGEAENYLGKMVTGIDQNDRLRVYGRYVYAINNRWDLGLEAQYERIFESKLNGEGRNDSSATLFAGPAVFLKIPEWKGGIGLSTQFSLYQDYENTDLSLGSGTASEDFRIEMKFIKRF